MNTKDKNYKEYLRLEAKLSENWDAQKALGYKPLDKPIHDGYQIEYVLRKDIAARDDAWMYQSLLDDFGMTKWCKDKSFEVYNKKTKHKEVIKPFIKIVYEREYEDWIAKFQAFWTRSPKDDRTGWYNEVAYKCIVPEWYFDTKITKHYKTHYKVIDEVLLQEEAELEAQIEKYRRKFWKWHSSVPKHFTKTCNRKDRAFNKQVLRQNLQHQEPAIYKCYISGEYFECDEDWNDWLIYGVEKKQFKYNHKHYAAWLWW
jgi:hypothetical protein